MMDTQIATINNPVGGLKHDFFFPYIGNVIIPTDFHIFHWGRSTTNQWSITLGSPVLFRQIHLPRNASSTARPKKQSTPIGWAKTCSNCGGVMRDFMGFLNILDVYITIIISNIIIIITTVSLLLVLFLYYVCWYYCYYPYYHYYYNNDIYIWLIYGNDI